MLTIEFYVGTAWVGGKQLATLHNTETYNIPHVGDFIEKIDGSEYMVVDRMFCYSPDKTVVKIFLKKSG